MKHIIKMALIFAISFTFTSCGDKSEPVVNIETKDILTIEEIESSCGKITMYDRFGNEAGSGSGFVIENDLVITCYHVIADYNPTNNTMFLDTTKVKGTFTLNYGKSDSRPYDINSVVAFSETFDLAVLKLDAENLGVTPISLGDSDELALNDDLRIIGTPRGSMSNPNSIISANISQIVENYGKTEIQLSTGGGAEPGVSGGIVVKDGRAVAVYAASYNSTNIKSAVPINYLKKILLNLEEYTELSIENFNNERAFYKEGTLDDITMGQRYNKNDSNEQNAVIFSKEGDITWLYDKFKYISDNNSKIVQDFCIKKFNSDAYRIENFSQEIQYMLGYNPNGEFYFFTPANENSKATDYGAFVYKTGEVDIANRINGKYEGSRITLSGFGRDSTGFYSCKNGLTIGLALYFDGDYFFVRNYKDGVIEGAETRIKILTGVIETAINKEGEKNDWTLKKASELDDISYEATSSDSGIITELITGVRFEWTDYGENFIMETENQYVNSQNGNVIASLKSGNPYLPYVEVNIKDNAFYAKSAQTPHIVGWCDVVSGHIVMRDENSKRGAIYDEHFRYVGGMDDDWKCSGKGATYDLDNNTLFIGNYKNGARLGYGTLINSSNSYLPLSGEWEGNVLRPK